MPSPQGDNYSVRIKQKNTGRWRTIAAGMSYPDAITLYSKHNKKWHVAVFKGRKLWTGSP
jgi:hypothetical protein